MVTYLARGPSSWILAGTFVHSRAWRRAPSSCRKRGPYYIRRRRLHGLLRFGRWRSGCRRSIDFAVRSRDGRWWQLIYRGRFLTRPGSVGCRDAATGIITTVAGNGTGGFSGDNGPAQLASLDEPTGVAVDSAGNVFIADLGNQRIRRVDANTGIITTMAGNGTQTFSGDGGPATSAALVGSILCGRGFGWEFVYRRRQQFPRS